jgi:hypothetical protein
MTIPLITHAHFALQRHGWPALVGVFLLLLIWPLAHWGTDPARQQAASLQASLQAQRRQQVNAPDPRATQTSRMAEFQSRLPAAEGALEAVQVIHTAAAKHGVKLAAGEYRLLREGNSPVLQRYQITLPATGAYLDLRAWMASVLNTLPSIAIEELSLVRQNVGTPALESRVRWTLYLKAP